jgi:multifunctional beta-oxidation protein
MSKGKNEHVDVEKALAHRFEPSTFKYTERDVMLYALGVGEGATTPTDEKSLQFVYENSPNFAALPTMGE